MLVYPHSTAAFAKREAGGKGYNLYRASTHGFPVPRWVVIGRSEFARFMEEAGLKAEVSAKVSAFSDGKIPAADAAQAITRLFVDIPATERLSNLVLTAYEFLGKPGAVAVRSSCADEDGISHSFAGQLSSFLYVGGVNDAIDCVKRCFASAFSGRCLAYRAQNNLLSAAIEVAVILQEMVDPEASGVLFTCNPVSLSAGEFVVSAVYGVGEGLVSGELAADSYWLDASSGKVTRAEIADKVQALRRGHSGSMERRHVPDEKRKSPALDDFDLLSLFELGRAVTRIFERPQDIEWALKDGQLYLLQTRPVTSLPNEISGFPNLWDNSNIVESYGGITSPLSFAFALNNYRLVYQQFCEILGVSNRIVREMDHYLRNMLGCINGRVYYNLYNWYKLIGVLPGFENNREFMETMMGVRERLSQEISERTSPHPSWYTRRGRLRKIRVGIRFVFYHFFIQGIVDRFLRRFAKAYARYRAIDYSSLPGDKIFQHYLKMERVMIGDWKAPIINDFLCMVHFGLLRKLTSLWMAEAGPHIQNDLLAGDGSLESAEPTRELLKLAAQARAEPALENLIRRAPANELLETLNQSPHHEFYRAVRSYIERFGFRCMNEMKLEEIDLFSDPSYLFTCLKNYLNRPDLDPSSMEKREHGIRRAAEDEIQKHLRGMRLRIYRWVLFHARKAVRNRENTRFARTRAYGITRSMFQAIGQDLAGLGVIERARDIFFLTLEEIYGIYQGTLSCYALKDFAALRKRQYEEFANSDPASRFLTRGAVYWRNSFSPSDSSKPAPAGNSEYDLKGLPCCPGIVEGVVKVVASSSGDLALSGEILVTPRTDPGWVPLYPSVSGLLVERGSLLSHSAIVAREMGLPAIVGIQGLTQTLKSGMRVRMDGGTGTIKIL